MKVSFITLGCKINQFYTDCIRQKYIDNGDEIVPLREHPDIAYLNTCSVTTHAGSESRKLYRRAKKYANEVRLMGCHAKLFPEEFEENYFIDEFGLIEEYSNPDQNRSRSYLPIQSGCNNFCTYCIVPYARGENYSLPISKVIQNIEERIDAGYPEVILTGIHIGSYKYKNIGLKGLLKELLKYNTRIRLSSIKPGCVDKEFLELFNNKNLMPYLHLSQQSGSDSILKRMGRKYTKEKTLWISRKLSQIGEEVRLAGDFIVGFPGEGKEEFQDTVNLIKESNFTHLHIFRYSKRPYTLASLFPDQVQDSIKKERAEVLKSLWKKQRARFIQEQIGKIYRVVIEKKSPLGKDWQTGMTPNYIRVHFHHNSKKENVLPIRIKDFKEGRVYGEIEE